MAKKKTTAPKQEFIAIDTYRDEVISIGTLNDVQEAIQEHADVEDYNEDEVSDNVTVYELGNKRTLYARTAGLEVTIEPA
jgi:hypothetical protein